MAFEARAHVRRRTVVVLDAEPPMLLGGTVATRQCVASTGYSIHRTPLYCNRATHLSTIWPWAARKPCRTRFSLSVSFVSMPSNHAIPGSLPHSNWLRDTIVTVNFFCASRASCAFLLLRPGKSDKPTILHDRTRQRDSTDVVPPDNRHEPISVLSTICRIRSTRHNTIHTREGNDPQWMLTLH